MHITNARASYINNRYKYQEASVLPVTFAPVETLLSSDCAELDTRGASVHHLENLNASPTSRGQTRETPFQTHPYEAESEELWSAWWSFKNWSKYDKSVGFGMKCRIPDVEKGYHWIRYLAAPTANPKPYTLIHT